jgi:hypothetical protein
VNISVPFQLSARPLADWKSLRNEGVALHTVKTIGLGLVVLVAMGTLGASGASAHEWQKGGFALLEPLPIEPKASTMTFEEKAREATFKCTLVHRGAGGEPAATVGGGAKGEIISVRSTTGSLLIPCEPIRVGIGGLCSTVHIEARALPWATELITTTFGLRNAIKEKTGSGAPGWIIRCETKSGGKSTNECSNETNTSVHNYSEGVEAEFDEKSPKGACVAGSGLKTTGVEKMVLWGGGVLSAI